MITVDQREAVIGFEMAHLGLGETPPGSNNSIPGAWYGLNGGPWCAMTQSWAYYSVLGYSPFPASTSKGFAYCASGVSWFRNQGLWAGSTVTPDRGWLIFFDWNADGHADHVGMVLGARGPNDVDTIEGNSSVSRGGPDVIGLHRRRSCILGYGIVRATATQPPPPPPAWQPPAFPGHTLKLGEQSQAVAILKVGLTLALGAGQVDTSTPIKARTFGDGTRLAVARLQAEHDQRHPDDKWGPASGAVGPKTWAYVWARAKAGTA